MNIHLKQTIIDNASSYCSLIVHYDWLETVVDTEYCCYCDAYIVQDGSVLAVGVPGKLTVGNLTVASVSVAGNLTVASVAGNLTAASVTVVGNLTVASVTVVGNLTVASGTGNLAVCSVDGN